MNTAPIRLLLVEDDEDDYVITRSALSDIGAGKYTLDWVRTYEEGLDTLARDEHDVVLVDYRLGGHTGIELLREANQNGYRAPIIMLTGQAEREIDLEAMRAGAADYLVKSQISAPLLERSIRYALERTQTMRALRKSEERYALAVRGANDGLWEVNLETDEVYFSPRWKAMLGYEDEEIQDRVEEWFSRVHPEDMDRLREEFAAHINGQTPHLEVEHRMMHKDGTYRWMLSRGIAVRNETGTIAIMAGSQTDITARKRAEEQLLDHATLYDALTGLPNRTAFLDRVTAAFKRAKRREDYLFAVLILDLDHFRSVNDNFGHRAGDELIVTAARRIEGCLRDIDRLARLGGDEFAILLDDIQKPHVAMRVAEQIQKQLTTPFALGDREVATSASIGIALSISNYDRPEAIVRDADAAMYRAKTHGRARAEVFDPEAHSQIAARLELEDRLHRALDQQEFRLHYQPIVSLESGRIAGFEALVRWQHSERGLLYPGEFLAVAEEIGLLVPIGWWMLQEACRQAQSWQSQYPAAGALSIGVNFSSRQFAQPELPDRIRQSLQQYNLPPSCLRLEITESTLLETAANRPDLLQRLKEQGIQLFIDDFGLGYSSLRDLHRSPIAALKVDQFFVHGIEESEEKARLVQATIHLAQQLGIEVVAEEIESAAQAARLRSLRCAYGQGYYFCKPVDSEAATMLLAAGGGWWKTAKALEHAPG